MNLIYINELGPNFRGDNIYEFIFSDVDDAYGEDWDVEPAAGRPSPPKIDFIKKVGILKNSDIQFGFGGTKGAHGIKSTTENNKHLMCIYGKTNEKFMEKWKVFFKN